MQEDQLFSQVKVKMMNNGASSHGIARRVWNLTSNRWNLAFVEQAQYVMLYATYFYIQSCNFICMVSKNLARENYAINFLQQEITETQFHHAWIIIAVMWLSQNKS